MSKDIRWLQRFENYKKAFTSLADDVGLATERDLSDIEQRGLIQACEYTYELSWNLIKDFYESQGDVSIQGSRDAFRLAFKRGLIENGEAFMKSVKSRQLSVHTYNEKTAKKVYSDIVNIYFSEFKTLLEKFEQLAKEDTL